jgi:hypothetical protein
VALTDRAGELDPLACRLLERERARYAAALATLTADDTTAALAEVNRHLDRVHEIMAEFVGRRAGRSGVARAGE